MHFLPLHSCLRLDPSPSPHHPHPHSRRLLRREEQLPGLTTSFQFALLSGPVKREAEFQALKRRHGSMFAWHGSGSGNWHVILRTGLRNMSNTQFMSTGAAYGSGIYFATDSATSLHYCTDSKSTAPLTIPHASYWPKSMFGSSLKCLALCEIIDKKEDFTKYKDASGILVVPREDIVTTRFFIVNPDQVNVSSEKLAEVMAERDVCRLFSTERN